MRTYFEHKDKTTAEDINPHYITPRMFQMRLQKIMDEYVAGVSTYYQTNGKLLESGLHYLTMLKEDSLHMRAKDLHELMRAWENYHRIWAGGGPPAPHHVPRGDALSGLLLPRRLPERSTTRTGSASSIPASTPRPRSGR